MDQEQSGQYLCQVSETVSCGACCGLYNATDASFEGLSRLLAHRSEMFAEIPREIDAITSFAEQVQAFEPQNRPLPDFHHCPFLGLIGGKRSRVGCLLHPKNPQNNGIDFRGLSHYGGMTCRVYFCPSARILDPVIARIVKSTVQNWYMYGLIITESRLLTAFFDEIERRIDAPLDDERFAAKPHMLKSLHRLFELKLQWPFRNPDDRFIGCYFFNDDLCPRPRIHFEPIGGAGSPYEAIFQELVSTFNSIKELHAAERMLDRLFSDIACRYR
ncbi:MAG: hypothetical protein R6U50_14410 [Desulfobacterales bacterium]